MNKELRANVSDDSVVTAVLPLTHSCHVARDDDDDYDDDDGFQQPFAVILDTVVAAGVGAVGEGGGVDDAYVLWIVFLKSHLP